MGKQLHARPVGTDGYSKVFFFSPQLFLYGPLKGADASTLLPSVPSQEYSASLFFFYFSSLSQTVTRDAELLSEKSF